MCAVKENPICRSIVDFYVFLLVFFLVVVCWCCFLGFIHAIIAGNYSIFHIFSYLGYVDLVKCARSSNIFIANRLWPAEHSIARFSLRLIETKVDFQLISINFLMVFSVDLDEIGTNGNFSKNPEEIRPKRWLGSEIWFIGISMNRTISNEMHTKNDSFRSVGRQLYAR